MTTNTIPEAPPVSMAKLVSHLRDTDQDFEFYPTTDEIIAKLVHSIRGYKSDHYHDTVASLLDIGAGNGKVLKALQEKCEFKDLYAIEKSPTLCQLLDKDVFIIGTDFYEQSLMSKQVDVTFCNPPYSDYEVWAEKIIRESASHVVYLVIPQRWQDSVEIAAALNYRNAEAKVVGEFSFEDAEDRQARAKVHLLKIELSTCKDDAFDRFFDLEFADLRAKFKTPEVEDARPDQPKFENLVVGKNYPERLVDLYNKEIDHIRKQYDLVATLDVPLMKEFDVTPDRIKGCLKARLAGLKNIYWQQLFNHMQQVTDRLTTSKRRIMLEKLNKNGHVDFTLPNIYAVIVWVIKNANGYIDTQLLEAFDKMVEQANVKNYKSNQRVFVNHRYRYEQPKPTHIALEYRLVLERCGGIDKDWHGVGHKLSESACDFIGDLLTVANNLGFTCDTADGRLHRYGSNRYATEYQNEPTWKSGKLQQFRCVDTHDHKKNKVLFEVRAYMNHNIHIRLNQDFALALNVEVGRLNGWLKNAQEAAEELQEPNAPKFFNHNHQLTTGSLLLLAAGEPENSSK